MKFKPLLERTGFKFHVVMRNDSFMLGSSQLKHVLATATKLGNIQITSFQGWFGTAECVFSEICPTSPRDYHFHGKCLTEMELRTLEGSSVLHDVWHPIISAHTCIAYPPWLSAKGNPLLETLKNEVFVHPWRVDRMQQTHQQLSSFRTVKSLILIRAL